ncbi:MerR family transcriptional regulator [Dactylosporangium roseum]|uniref:MerR family transcriptional regulator n=1 Tax=Dactylosporangium roseum TaxID=47989 RepID=A0ABY5ZF20_9ACTN|nr:chaperone modulator CbpM [Dactylosporangium roseum]UWZ39553.1 MerR family transcriptional regulator [Dactylosporangium roseum]
MTYALVRPRYLSLDAFAAAARLHPELVARLAALGLLEPSVDARGIRWFRAVDLAVAARIHRLYTGLPLNYAAIGVLLDLLDRIDELEATLRRRSWTSTD